MKHLRVFTQGGTLRFIKSVFVSIDRKKPHIWRRIQNERFDFMGAKTMTVGSSLFAIKRGDPVTAQRYDKVTKGRFMTKTELP